MSNKEKKPLTGKAKCDQSYSRIILRKNELVQRQYGVIQRRNSKIKELNTFLDELLKEGKITKDQLINRFKKVVPEKLEESTVEEEKEENPFFAKK